MNSWRQSVAPSYTVDESSYELIGERILVKMAAARPCKRRENVYVFRFDEWITLLVKVLGTKGLGVTLS